MALHFLLPAPDAVADQARRGRRTWWVSYLPVLAASMALGLGAPGRLPAATTFALALMLVGGVLVVVRPLVGVYLCTALTLVGDSKTAPWFPFAKNLSSRESLLFLHESLAVSPIDVFLVLSALGWGLSLLGRRERFERGLLLWPVVALTAFVVAGLANGLATGGDRETALWLVRPLLYLPLVYVLTTNLCRQRRHLTVLFWVVAGALAVEGVNGVVYRLRMTPAEVEGLGGASLVEHTAALHMNGLLVLAAAVWLLPGCSRAMRLVLPLLCLPVLVVYAESERRSAFVGLVAGLCILGALLLRVDRGRFWRVAPVAAILVVGFVAATWNASGPAGYPAQAVKSVVAPGQLGAEDQSSNAYRESENYDLVETVRAAPVQGIGFGHKFLRPLPLPDISFFVWWEYVPHNSILWVWTQTGVGGIVAMLYLFGSAIARGMRSAVTLASGDGAAMAVTALALLVMFMIFAYVDMAWDAQTTLLLGVALAVVGSVERVVGPACDAHR